MNSISTIITGLKIAAKDFFKQFGNQATDEDKDYIALKQKLSTHLLQMGEAKYPELLKESLERRGIDVTAPVEINKFDARFLLAKEKETQSSLEELSGYCRVLYDTLDKELPQKMDVIKEFDKFTKSSALEKNELFLFALAIKHEWYKRVNELATEVKEKKLAVFSDDFELRTEKLQRYLSLPIFGDSEYNEITDLLFNVHDANVVDLLNFSREQTAKNLNRMISLTASSDIGTTSP